MDIQRLSDTLIEIDGRVRCERGPRLIEVDKATPEILSDDVTARHYHRGGVDKFGRTIVIDEFEGDVYGPDVISAITRRPIPNSGPLLQRGSGALVRAGQPFAYLDWAGPHVWHIYELTTEAWTGPNTLVVNADGDPERDEGGKYKLELGPAWRRRGVATTEAEAMVQAGALANSLRG